MNPGFAFLNSFSSVSEESFNKLFKICELKQIKAGTQIVELGDIPTKVYMLVSGVARCYLCTESGKEFNKNFFLPISMVASLTALINRSPSLFVFETLTDCEFYEVDFNNLMTIVNNDLEINILYSKVLESLYMKYESRLVELISLDAKDRYLELKKQIPKVDNLIPQYHIASYLGITPVQLSRIRKKIDVG